MLNINANETKKIKFGVSIAGIQLRDIKGALRLKIEGIEYGFPIEIEDGKVVAEIPPLKDLIQEVDELKRYDVKLELIAGDTYIVPWTDIAKIKLPIKISVAESSIEEEEIESKQKVSVVIANVDEEVKPEPVEPEPVVEPVKPESVKIVEKKKPKISKMFKNELVIEKPKKTKISKIFD